ncbi:unnamed protein product [Cuscuta europaea]|uniref:Uncharacterized protein n=1 Tax=Cuscuta europaea TaxID=41803 RepID=A0A9P1A1K7_CUSEU|nr:unnamed protein product [Cuscuta europaea]
MDDLVKLIWGCWTIWSERNQRVWKDNSMMPQQFMYKAENLVVSWAQAQSTRCIGRHSGLSSATFWRQPTVGKMKLNIDAAVRGFKCHLGWCVRDDGGGL